MSNLPSGRKWNELDSWIWEVGFSWNGSRELDLRCEIMNELERNGLGLSCSKEMSWIFLVQNGIPLDRQNKPVCLDKCTCPIFSLIPGEIPTVPLLRCSLHKYPNI